MAWSPDGGPDRGLSLNGDRPYSFDAEVTRHGQRIVVALVGELDIATSDALERRIVPLLDRDAHVIADLAGLQFIDVAGIRALFSCAKHAQAHGARFSIALGSARVRRLFELCRMLDEFEFVYESLAAVPS